MVIEQIEFFVETLIKELPQELKDLVRENCFVAGGCFNSLYHKEQPKDFDIYFKNKKAKDDFNKYLVGNKHLFTRLITNNSLIKQTTTKNATTFMLKNFYIIQFITRWTGDVDKIISKFDFLHTQIYYDIKTKKSNFEEKRFTLNKTLQFNINASHPINALKRVIKFVKERNCQISDIELMKICLAIKQLNLVDEKVLIDQMTGMYNMFDTEVMSEYKKVRNTLFSNKINNLLEE
jgi:hypothetical protein